MTTSGENRPYEISPERTSLGCARCGACCQGIRVGFDPRDKPRELVNDRLFDPRTDEGWARWAEDWKAEHSREEALERWLAQVHDTAFFAANWRVLWADDAYPGSRAHHWVIECLQYDADSRQCLAHDEQPRACSRYPWYDHGPERRSAGHLQHGGETGTVGVGCSYLLDVPPEQRAGLRPLIPLEVIRG